MYAGVQPTTGGGIDLNGQPAPGVSPNQFTDLGVGSQIIFGNIPATLYSQMNGRWSNPST